MTTVYSPFRLKIMTATVFAACALVSTPSWADAGCGKDGFADTPVAEQEFGKRVIEVMYLHFLVPPENWGTDLSSRRSGGYFENQLGPSKVCKRVIDRIRSTGTNDVSYRKVIAAPAWAARNTVTQECNLRRNEINKLPPDKQAQFDDLNTQRTDLNRQVREARRANQHALADEKYKESEKLGSPMQSIKNEHDKLTQPQLSNLYKECKTKEDAIFDNVSYSVRLVVNASAGFKPFQDEFIVHDIGDRNLRTGPSDKTRRFTLAARSNSPKRTLDAQEMALIKSWVDWPRLQNLLDQGGNLPGDSERAQLKATQDTALKSQADWSTAQNKQNDQTEREARNKRQADEATTRRVAQPNTAPSPSQATGNANTPAPAPAPVAQPAPPAPAAPNIPQIPGNVGNVLRGVFGR